MVSLYLFKALKGTETVLGGKREVFDARLESAAIYAVEYWTLFVLKLRSTSGQLIAELGSVSVLL